MRLRQWVGVAATFGAAGGVVAQQGNNTGWVDPTTTAAIRVVADDLPPVAPPPVPVLPDPTKASPKLKEALRPPPIATPGSAAQRLPAMTIRARIVTRARPSAAVIDVDGKAYTVSPGDAIAAGVVIRVLEVTPSEIRLEVGPDREIVVLH